MKWVLKSVVACVLALSLSNNGADAHDDHAVVEGAAKPKVDFRESVPVAARLSKEAPTALPANFAEFEITSRLDAAPVGLIRAPSPDGRLFISTDDNDDQGTIWVVKNDELLSTPALRMDIRSDGEHGMIGWVLDPNFIGNGHLYLMYTTTDGGIHNRISRFTFSGDVIDPNTEVVLMDLDTLGNGTAHNGGGMAFGNDGKLYVGVGDNQVSTHSANLGTVFGKILRINPDGTIPNDNPFQGQTDGIRRAIYALGVRNPFSMDADDNSSSIFFNDTGPASYEEVNEIEFAADYGWPSQGAGPNRDPGFKDPVYTYKQRDMPGSCAITAGNFHRTSNPSFPSEHTDKYYFADYCGAWIYGYDLATGDVEAFATNTSEGPVSLEVGDDGSLYYLSRGERKVFRIEYLLSDALRITQHPQDVQVAVNQGAIFSVRAVPDSSDGPFTYQWQEKSGNGSFSDMPGATERSLTIDSASSSDDGKQYRAIVVSGLDSVTSNSATLIVSSGNPPVAVITAPDASDTYVAGGEIDFSGFATDPDESGDLPDANLTWEVTFQHNDHDHPQFGPVSGLSGSSFVVPTIGETSAQTWFRIHLTAVDSSGLLTYVYRDIFPEKSTFTIDSNLPGVELLLDGSPVTSPTSTLGVVGLERIIGAPSLQSVNGTSYEFVGWSDGGDISHVISTPASDRTFTATYAEVLVPNTAPTASGSASPPAGAAPLSVSFDAADSTDDEGGLLSYSWDFTTDGSIDADSVATAHTFTSPGTYTTTLTVTDSGGLSDVATFDIVVGNTTGGTDGTGTGGGTGDPNLRLTYENKAPDPFSHEIEAQVALVNDGSETVDLTGTELRYFFDPDGLTPEAKLKRGTPLSSATTVTYVAAGSGSYVALAAPGSLILAPGERWVVRFKVEDVTSRLFDQNNDLSFKAARTSPGTNPDIAILLPGGSGTGGTDGTDTTGGTDGTDTTGGTDGTDTTGGTDGTDTTGGTDGTDTTGGTDGTDTTGGTDGTDTTGGTDGTDTTGGTDGTGTGGGTGDLNLRLTYENKAPDLQSREIEATLRIVNDGSAPADLLGTELRYFFDPDGLTPMLKLKAERPADGQVRMFLSDTGGETFLGLEVTQSLVLQPGGSLLLRFRIEDALGGGVFDQTNDASFIRGQTSPGPNADIALILPGGTGTGGTDTGGTDTGGTDTGGTDTGGTDTGGTDTGGTDTGGTDTGGTDTGGTDGGTDGDGTDSGGGDGGGTTDGGGPPGNDGLTLRLRYENKAPNPVSPEIEAQIVVINDDTAPASLQGVGLRYFFNPDGRVPEIRLRRSSPEESLGQATFTDRGSDSFITIRATGPLMLAPGERWTVRFKVKDVDNREFDQTNDLSWIPGQTTDGPNPNIALVLPDDI